MHKFILEYVYVKLEPQKSDLIREIFMKIKNKLESIEAINVLALKRFPEQLVKTG